MQENNFEIQVRKQLEELEFRPSAPVWNNVAASIRRKRRRRAAAYFSIIALLGLGIWTWSNSGNKIADSRQEKEIVSKNVVNNNESTSTEKNAVTANKLSQNAVVDKGGESIETEEKAVDIKADITPTSGTETKSDPSEKSPVKSDIGSNKNSVSGKKDMVAKTSETGNKKAGAVSLSSNTRKKNNKVARNNNENKSNSNLPASETELDNNSATANSNTETKTENNTELSTALQLHNKVDATPDSSHVAAAMLLDSLNIAHVVAEPVQKISKRKISWGFEVSAGAGSRMNTAIPGITGTADKVDLYQGSAVYAPPASFAVVRSFPSASLPRVGFSIGATARIPIAKRINLVGGLRYHYQSERIDVGSKKDTSIQFVNAASNLVDTRMVYNGPVQYDHTNRYHFLQAPVAIEFQINRGRKTPIFLEAGAAPGLMLGSNALVYDTAYNGIYYKDKSTFKKFHVSANTALSIQFGNKSRLKWAIGPELRMHLTPLAESRYDNRQYLLYGGLRARVFLR